MNKFHRFVKSHTITVSLVSISAFFAPVPGGERLVRAPQAGGGANASPSDDALIADFRRVEVASVSDALGATYGQAYVHESSHASDLDYKVCRLCKDGSAQER